MVVATKSQLPPPRLRQVPVLSYWLLPQQLQVPKPQCLGEQLISNVGPFIPILLETLPSVIRTQIGHAAAKIMDGVGAPLTIVLVHNVWITGP